MTHFKNVYMFWGQTGFGLNASESSTQTGPGIIFEVFCHDWKRQTHSAACSVFLKTVKSERESKRYRILDAWQDQLWHKHRSFVICGSWLNLDWCCSQKPKIALKGFCKKTKKQLCIFLWVAFKIMDMPSSTRKSLIMTICGIIYSSFKSWKIKSHSSVSKTFSQISQWAG